MAIWQYDTHVVPLTETQPWIHSSVLVSVVTQQVRRTLIDSPKWGANIEINKVIEWMDHTLNRGERWDEEVESWGHIDGNTVQLVMMEGKLADVFVRFDLRSTADEFLGTSVELASRISGAFVGQDGKIFNSLDGLRLVLADSSARSFVLNPSEHLRELDLDTLNKENDA